MRGLRVFLAIAVVSVGLLRGPSAAAQPNDELALGRQLFTEALDDEDHRRFAAALEKYQRVARIKDTASIRYRMGRTLESLGKLTQAVDAYTTAVRLAGPSDEKLAHASRTRIDELEHKIAHLTILVRPSAKDAEVRVDDELLATSALEDARVDPGAHVIVVSAPGALDARASVTLSEGGRAEIPIVLAPIPAPAPEPPAPAPPPGPGRPLAIGATILGGALVLSGLAVAGLRHGDISDLRDSCPGGRCPSAREEELRSIRDRALFEGPLAVTLLSAGVVALGVGVFFWFRARASGGAVAP